MYERSDFGDGPYSNVFGCKDIYYGGPSYYYIKNDDKYYELNNSRKVQKSELEQLNTGVEEKRQEYLNGETSTLSLKEVSTRVAIETFFLGHDIKDTELNSTAKWYFITYAILLNYGFDEEANIQIFGDNVETPVDMFCGVNYFGSCVSVALGLAMRYYDDLGVADMIPDDLSNFHTMYYYKFASSNEYMVKCNNFPSINLSSVNKNELRTERVHQELLYQNFPQYRGLSIGDLSKLQPFGYVTNNVGNLYKTYALAHGLKDYKFVAEKGTYWLPENIIAGNPCIVSLKPGTPYLDETLKLGHAALAYAFTGTHPLWYTVDEIVCNMGMDDKKEYGCIYINSEFVNSNVRINVF